MRVIKRYPNRKLYDTVDKQYISLERIAELIRQGEEVHVVDHASREDLTTVTLTQVIFEQEKKQDNELPRTVLTALIRASGDTLGVLRRTLAPQIDFFRQVDEEIERRVRDLVRRGELAEEEGRRLVEELLSVGRRGGARGERGDAEIQAALNRRGTPSREEFTHLNSQIDALLASLDELSTPEQPAAKPRARRKPKPTETANE